MACCLQSSSVPGIFASSVKKFRISSLKVEKYNVPAKDIDTPKRLATAENVHTYERIITKILQIDGVAQ